MRDYMVNRNPDCKSVSDAFEGSNPSPPMHARKAGFKGFARAGLRSFERFLALIFCPSDTPSDKSGSSVRLTVQN